MSILRSAQTVDRKLVDVSLDGGRITEIVPASGALGAEDLHLGGYVLLPSFIEPHAHLDKALTSSQVANATGDLNGAIVAMNSLATLFSAAEIAERVEQALRIYLGYGTTHIRTHVNVGISAGMKSVEALVRVRERWHGLVDLQVVATLAAPIAGAGENVLREALSLGADVVGGAPYRDTDRAKAIALCLQIAWETARPVDLHIDETLDADVLSLETLADQVLATRFPLPVTASHCVSLGVQPEDVQRRVSEKVAAAGIAVVALPQTNLYLQGRGQQVAKPRGLTAVTALRNAGVTLAAGGDNFRDAFHPLGRGDALEVAALMVTCGHLDPLEAIEAVTIAPRRALRLDPLALQPGAAADMVALRADNPIEALAAAGPERIVWRNGRVVAQTGVIREIASPEV